MQLFVDTAEVEEIRELDELGVIDGVTTNPSLIMKSGRSIHDVLKEICSFIGGPVSAEVVATSSNQMIAEGLKLSEIAPNIVVKVPLTWDGLKACNNLSGRGIKVNVTLCFSGNQALLAAKCGATFISPFIGRLDDLGINGMELIETIRTIYDNYDFETAILVASIRSPLHVVDSALIGADAATVPPKIYKQLATHPMTDKGLASFLDDWNKTGLNIA